MVTDVDGVYLHLGQPEQRRLGDVTPGGTGRLRIRGRIDGPKVEAATRFVGRTGRRAAIGSLAGIVAGTVGTSTVAQKATAGAALGS